MPDEDRLVSDPTDDELLRRSAAGETAAFEAFVTRHERWLLRYAVALAGADGEEVMQDAFVGAWRGAATFAGNGTAKGWLVAIARNAYRRRFRHRAGEPASHTPIEDIADFARAAGWGADGPDAAFERLATREALQRAMARLPAAEREILILRDLEELSGEEAAASLGLTLAAAKSRLHRARLHLAAVLKEPRHG